jgi:fibro-slime domain-containing protein
MQAARSSRGDATSGDTLPIRVMKLERIFFLGTCVLVSIGCADSSGAGTGAGGSHSGSSGTKASGSTFAGPSGTTGSAGTGGACGTTLHATVRDFSSSHPDFEKFLGDDANIVTPDLGADGKPVYAGNPTTATTSGKADFDQWYRDVAGANLPFMIDLPLVDAGGGVYTYDNSAYFPIDNQGFGNEGNPHNFHFTTEIHTIFTYSGGEVFTFTGDDDLFAYVNKKLVINLGGVHGAETTSVSLDQVAGQIGIVVGKTYALDLFGAERHTSESNFRVDTTIGCFTTPPPPQ